MFDVPTIKRMTTCVSRSLIDKKADQCLFSRDLASKVNLKRLYIFLDETEVYRKAKVQKEAGLL